MTFDSRFGNMKVTDEPVYKSELLAGTDQNVLVASSQWSTTLLAPAPLPNGSRANGCTFFTDLNKVIGGNTPYYEFNLRFGLSWLLSGTSGSATITIGGVGYPVVFNTTLQQTAIDFVTVNGAAINAAGFQVFPITNTGGTFIRFGATTAAPLDAMIFTNTGGTLGGTKRQEFTGLAVAKEDHIVIQYIGTPVENLRLLHTIRTNFNIALGSIAYLGLGLYRWQNDTLIGSEIPIVRNQDETGNQQVFESYTAGANDPFVTGGFYLAIDNQSGVAVDFISSAGILIQTIFQKPVSF